MSMDKNQLTAEALGMLLEWAKRADAFASEQVPAVAQEIVAYGRVSSVVVLSLTLSCAIAGLLATKRLHKFVTKEHNGSDAHIGVTVFGSIGTVVLLVIGAIGTCESGNSAILAWFAPRLYVIEYVGNLLK